MPRFTPSPRSQLAGAALALVAAFASAATAEIPDSGFDFAWQGLTKDEIVRIHAAAQRLYEGQSIGTIERWRSPETKNAGEVTLINSFDLHGLPCRTLDYTIRFAIEPKSPDHYVLNWCRIADGSWKIVELSHPHPQGK